MNRAQSHFETSSVSLTSNHAFSWPAAVVGAKLPHFRLRRRAPGPHRHRMLTPSLGEILGTEMQIRSDRGDVVETGGVLAQDLPLPLPGQLRVTKPFLKLGRNLEGAEGVDLALGEP